MSATYSHVRPDTFLFLRLPTETLKLVEIKLNTIIDVGKLGSFPSNLLVGRPYHHTYELLEKQDGEFYSRLRVVPPSELNAGAGLEDVTPTESRGEPGTPSGANGVPESFDLLAEDGTVLMKNNRLTIDDASRQQLTQAEIEELKKSSGGKEVIEKILANHTGLDEKTAFAKAKYTLRKHKKYLKRFTVLPMDLGHLIDYVTEKEPPRIMEMREEALGLVSAWSHAHFSGADYMEAEKGGRTVGGGRWLVVDEAGGLVVAGLAERMNILHQRMPAEAGSTQKSLSVTGLEGEIMDVENAEGRVSAQQEHQQGNGATKPPKQVLHRDFPAPATTNSITLLHPAVQPNVSLLKYFGYDTSSSSIPTLENEHPLHTRLKPLSWLQLLHPTEDPTYSEPEHIPEDVLSTWKSGKRGMYFKKRRRWERCKAIVDETCAGGFDGLVVASHMDLVTVLAHTVPLIRGGGHIVLYSPTIEPLVKVMDLYSKERRAAYMGHLSKGELPSLEDFPLDPRLLLAPTLQTSRIREWQVLPGRTHPLMTGRGGAEGYVFTASRVTPLEGGVEARGNFTAKRRKIGTATEVSGAVPSVAVGPGANVDALLASAADAE